jgi:hypothetical protein
MKGTRLNNSSNNDKKVKQIKESVIHVGKWICYLSVQVQQLSKIK